MNGIKWFALVTALAVSIVLLPGCGGTHTGNPSGVADAHPELEVCAVAAFRLVQPGNEWHIETYLAANPLLKRAGQVIERTDTLIGDVLYLVVPVTDTLYRADTTFVNEVMVDANTVSDTVDSIIGGDTIIAVFSVLKTDSIVVIDTIISVDTIIYSDTLLIKTTIVQADSTEPMDSSSDSGYWNIESAEIVLLDGSIEERTAPQYMTVSYDNLSGASYEYTSNSTGSLILVPVDDDKVSLLSFENMIGVESMLLRTADGDGPKTVSYGLDPGALAQDTMLLAITRENGYADIASSSVVYKIARDPIDPSGRSDRLVAVSGELTYRAGDVHSLVMQVRFDTPCVKGGQPQSGTIDMAVELNDGAVGMLAEGQIDMKAGLLYGVYRKNDVEVPVILDKNGDPVEISVDIIGENMP